MVIKYFLILFLISFFLLGRLMWPFLSILMLSFILAGIFQPIYLFINKKFSPAFSSLNTCLLIIVIVFLPLTFFVGALSQEAYNLYLLGKGANFKMIFSDLFESTVIQKINQTLEQYGIAFEPAGFNKAVSEIARKSGLFLFNQATYWAANIMHLIFNFFMMIITIYFLLIDHDRLIKFILRLSPMPDDQERRLIRRFKEMSGAVLIGNGICGIIQGVLGGFAFVFFDFGSPIIWGGVMSILAFLPIFGIGLVLIPAAVVLLLQAQIAQAIVMLIFYASLSFSVEYLIKPKLVGRQVKMHTLIVFLSIMGGLALFGFLGIIYGPLIATAFLTFSEIYLTNYSHYVTKDPAKLFKSD